MNDTEPNATNGTAICALYGETYTGYSVGGDDYERITHTHTCKRCAPGYADCVLVWWGE